MLFSIIKITLGLITSFFLFILWNLNCNKTLIRTSKIEKTTIAYILNYAGNHNSLLLKDANGWKEFSYGDWDVYGRSKITFWTGFKSMGLPSQGALGFRIIKWDGQANKQLLKIVEANQALPLSVSAPAAHNLCQSLENYIAGAPTKPIYNPQNKLYFIPYAKAYAAWHTCNNMLITWLEKMEVEVIGKGWAGNFLIISEEHV